MNGLPVLDLRDPTVREALAVELDTLTGPRERAQELAARVRDLGADGLIVPSAARPDHWNLVVFPAGFDRVTAAGSRLVRPAPPGSAS